MCAAVSVGPCAGQALNSPRQAAPVCSGVTLSPSWSSDRAFLLGREQNVLRCVLDVDGRERLETVYRCPQRGTPIRDPDPAFQAVVAQPGDECRFSE